MKYKNATNQDLDLIGFGSIMAGEEFDTDQVVENPNFVVVGQEAVTPVPQPPAPVAPAPEQPAVAPEAPQTDQNNQ